MKKIEWWHSIYVGVGGWLGSAITSYALDIPINSRIAVGMSLGVLLSWWMTKEPKQ